MDNSISSSKIIKNAGVIISNCGTVSWESILMGKPAIVFGWAWFTECKSCFVVDSVETLREAINQSKSISKEEVFKDRDEFIKKLERRLIYAVNDRGNLSKVGKDYVYQ